MIRSSCCAPRFKGFDGASGRFLAAATPGASSDDVFVPLTEALWWAVSVDDGFEDLAANTGGYRPNLGDYKNARGNDPSGRVLLALRYARDRCGHQRALVVAENGLRVPFTLPAVVGEYFRWRPSGQLPPAPAQFQSGRLLPAFDSLLAGQPAERALGSAATWFAQEEGRAGL
jgi:hypothetical protein